MLWLQIKLYLLHVASATAQTACPTGGNGCDTGLPRVAAGGTQVNQILQVVFGIIGGLALLFIIIGALRYTISAGDPQAAAKARSTIIYAAVGLVIAVSAEAIVTFVLSKAA